MVTSVISITETTITVQFRPSISQVNYMSYTVNGQTYSAWIPIEPVTSGSIGYFTIDNLTPNTTYRVILRGSETGTSGDADYGQRASVTTYSFPHASATPDYVLGSLRSFSVDIYNPLNKVIQVQLLTCNDNIVATWTGAYTTVSFGGSVTQDDILYASIPNAQSANYKIRVISGQSQAEDITTTGGVYSVDPQRCLPVISNFAYEDSNSAIVAITQDDQKIVQSLSVPEYSANVTGSKSATISSASITVNGLTFPLTISNGVATGSGGVIDSVSDVNAVLTITDSRGISVSEEISVEVVEWKTPTAIINIGREQNYYSETDFTIDASYTQVGNSTITINVVCDAVPISGQTTPSQVTATLSDNVTSVLILDNLFEWDVVLTLSDSFGAITTYTGIHIGKGIPITFVDRKLNSFSVNGFPTHPESIEVFNGHYYRNGNCIFPVGFSDGGINPVNMYNNHSSGSLTNATTKVTTYTVSGDGVVMVSGSMVSGVNTWGTTRVVVELNNTVVSFDSDTITSDYNGQKTSANAIAFLKVQNGDEIKITGYSTRYTSGNTYDFYTNVLAMGCTLS